MRTRPDQTTEMELLSGKVTLDGHGYIVDPEAWTPNFARVVAGFENIELTQTHWDVIDFMRKSYANRGVAVDVRHVNKFLALQNGISKHDGRRLLFELFPYGYVKQAVKIAGMKQPRAWSTG